MKNIQRKAAKEFAAYWKDKGYEKGESQKFWLSLLRDVFGMENGVACAEPCGNAQRTFAACAYQR